MVKLLAVDCALDACQIAVLARFQSPSNRQALRPSAQNQELRPLTDEKPATTFSESGLKLIDLTSDPAMPHPCVRLQVC
jgi:hypothetical protein